MRKEFFEDNKSKIISLRRLANKCQRMNDDTSETMARMSRRKEALNAKTLKNTFEMSMLQDYEHVSSDKLKNMIEIHSFGVDSNRAIEREVV